MMNETANAAQTPALDGRISKSLVKSKSGEFDVESIHTLSLCNIRITDLGCLGECTAIERLDLSNNDVTKLYTLAGLACLSHLNLSGNRISSLEGLQSLDSLQHLNLAGNLIGSVDAVNVLSTLVKLEELRLQDSVADLTNPVCMNLAYKQGILRVLPNLAILDGERLSGQGSELFKLCDELELMLKARDQYGCGSATKGSSDQWMTGDYLENKRVAAFEQSSLGDAEFQLQALLADCKRVGSEAEKKLQAALSKQTATPHLDL